jgi:hypothetical protein
MMEGFRMGGWPMYFVALAGLALVTSAVSYAWSPDARRRAVVHGLAAVTALTACFGFVAGATRTLAAAGQVDDGRVVTVGIGESLHNLELGFALLALAAVAMAVGACRRGTAGTASSAASAELADPHAR